MMLAAQLLLTGLVINWLMLQYRDEEIALSDQVNFAWISSYHQMTDSILMQDYIEPAISNLKPEKPSLLNDSSARRTVFMKFDSHDVKMNAVVKTENPSKIPDSSTKLKKRIIVRISDSTENFNQLEKNIDSSKTELTRDLVLRGVKLFIDNRKDSVETRRIFKPVTFQDTTMFKKIFKQNLKDISPSLLANWSTIDSLESYNLNNTNSFIRNNGAKSNANSKNFSRGILRRKSPHFTFRLMPGNSIKVNVTGYKLLALKQIAPQSVFAIFIILLTAAAFIYGFKNLKTQLNLNTQRDDFIRNMSHELNTPVATVKVALESLKNFNRSQNPELMSEYLEMAYAEATRLEKLINRVLDVSSYGKENMLLKKELVNFEEFMNDFLRSIKPRLEAEKAVINYFKSDEPGFALIDKLHLHGVFMNLIDNSLKYSTPPAEILITSSLDKNNIIILFADKGIGIPSEYQKYIFQKFFRVPTNDTHNIKGHGLGLTYASMIIEQHGGTINYYERKGGGSIFEITLKRVQT